MRHIIETSAASGEWLIHGDGAGCAIRIIAPDASPLQSCSVDRVLFVLSGAAAVTIGTETFEAPQHALVLLPAGTPHRIGGEARLLDVLAPAPSAEPFHPATARTVESASGLVRPLLAENFSKGGFAYQSLADRASGSANLRVNIVEVQPGAGSPDFHIHAFDQFYFILAGRMHVEVGRKLMVAEAGSLVHLPAGIVHRNYNLDPEAETHVTLIAPEPAAGEIFDYACDIRDREAELMEKQKVTQR
ncbi:MAG: cupin domain-containing protein [Rhizobiaceae bacterium]